MVEVTNDSAVPVALVLALRPYRLDARGRISSVELLAADGPRDRVVDDAAPSGAAASREGIVIRVDEADVLLVDRRPVRVAHGTPVDVASALATGSDDKLEGAAEHLVARRWDATPGEDLEVAFVFPLAHTATLTAALSPVDQPVAAATGGGSAFNRAPFNRAPFNRARSAEPTPPLVLPALSSVARGWALHSADDVELTWVVDAAGKVVNWSAGMLRVAGPDAVTAALDPTGSDRARSAAMELESICRALSSLPAGELHLAVASALVRAQRFSGRVEPRRGQDATSPSCGVAGPLLWCDQALRHAEEMAGPVAKALRWLERNGADGGAPVEGPRRSSAAAEALRRVAVGLSVVGQPDPWQSKRSPGGRYARGGHGSRRGGQPREMPSSTVPGTARITPVRLSPVRSWRIWRRSCPVRAGTGETARPVRSMPARGSTWSSSPHCATACSPRWLPMRLKALVVRALERGGGPGDHSRCIECPPLGVACPRRCAGTAEPGAAVGPATVARHHRGHSTRGERTRVASRMEGDRVEW
ncbi:MAG: hypothetical protein M5U19_12045 [Microthrixaceae bacterium]|nr:hypothetical protein [Microthrixaceae bacterium]